MKVKILFCRFGENITTDLSPVREYTDQDLPLLEIIDRYCASYDDNRLVPGHKYSVREIDLPGWLPADQYCDNYLKWNFILGYPCIIEKLGPRSISLIRMEYIEIKALASLFQVKKFRSSFRESIYNQVLNWFYDDREDKYRSPLSEKQWIAISRYIR